MEHSQHGSKAMLWLEPELQRVLGFTGKEATPVEIRVRPYMCVICDKAVAMPTLAPDEKKSMGAEWLVNEHSHIEIGGILICRNCWPSHPKLRIDSYRVSGGTAERCNCTWDGSDSWICVVCGTKDRTLMSSRSVWESIRVMKPIGLFQEGIVTRFSRHPWVGMRKHERIAFLETRIPIFPSDDREIRNQALREREALVGEILDKDRESDLSLADLESTRWSLTLWQVPILGCFPEVEMKRGSSGKLAWVYVKRGQEWRVRTWGSLAMELAQESGWEDSPNYNKDYRGTLSRSNVTKEKRQSRRKEKFVELEVAPVKDMKEHKVWRADEKNFCVGSYYGDDQLTEVPEKQFKIVMHLKINVLTCAHPDFNWIGGIEAELHEKQPEVKMIKKGLFRRAKRLVEPKN